MQKILIPSVLILSLVFYFGCQDVAPTDPTAQLDKKGNGNGNTILVPGDYSTIQEAIDAAASGDVIKVDSDIYTEELLIEGKDITLIANGNVTLAPTAPTAHGDAISIYDGTVTVDGFNIDANNCQGGIYAGGGYPINDLPVTVSILNNEVYGYAKNGITVNGSNAYGNVLGNTTIGSGPVGPGSWAQNGIQFGYGSTGKARNNSVEGNWYTGDNWGATGILIFETSEVIVQNNVVMECQTGIAIETWGWFLPNANNNKIDRNTVNDCEYGISVAAYDLGGYSKMDAFAVNNKVVNNKLEILTLTDAYVGIGIWSGSYWGGNGTTPTADNNKIITNTIVGYDTATDQDGATNSKVHANVY